VPGFAVAVRYIGARVQCTAQRRITGLIRTHWLAGRLDVPEEILVQRDARYWFPAKRYGWGWGPPATWQGWLVLIVFMALVAAGTFLLPPRRMMAAYLLYVFVLSVALIGVCWLKGEPPRWRWGGHER